MKIKKCKCKNNIHGYRIGEVYNFDLYDDWGSFTYKVYTVDGYYYSFSTHSFNKIFITLSAEEFRQIQLEEILG